MTRQDMPATIHTGGKHTLMNDFHLDGLIPPTDGILVSARPPKQASLLDQQFSTI